MKWILATGFLFVMSVSCQNRVYTDEKSGEAKTDLEQVKTNTMDTATLGAGCFWCVEAVFNELKGVKSVMPGYAGGKIKNPTYKEVTSGLTGHAEVAQIEFDPEVISFDEILEVFWQTHDPTTVNRQGNDVGTQYRSVVFYHNEEQHRLARNYKDALNNQKVFSGPVVTEIVPFEAFYPAEDYHKNFYANNENYGYCRVVIKPKLEKLKKVFPEKVK